MEKKGNKGSMDYTILFVTLALTAIGVVMVYSASFYASGLQEGDNAFQFRRQLMWAGVGLAMMLIASRIDYRIYDRKPLPFVFLLIGFALLVGVLVFGKTINDTKRWFIIMGVSVQPAEIAKLCMILFMASSLSRNQNIKTFWYGTLPYIVLAAGYAGLVILQPNFSTTITIMLIAVAMLIAAGVRIWHLGLMGLAGGVAATALVFSADYRMERIQTFLDPFADPSGSGYQVVQSLYSLGAGGLFGLGLGQSRQKFLYLPYREADFIFSIVGEELGFIGAILIIILFAILCWRGLRTAMMVPDAFGSLLATGIVCIIAIQTIINIAVVSGAIPATGLPLPFISAGGSSLAIFMTCIGILLNISKNIRKV